MACKLGPASIKATNLRLEVVKEEVQTKQEVVERRKAEIAAAKQQRDRRGISSSNEDDDNYYSDTDDTDPDQENNLNPVQGRNSGREAGVIPDLAECQSEDLFQPVHLRIHKQTQQEIRVTKK